MFRAKKISTIILLATSLSIGSTLCYAKESTAPVTGFARAFLTGMPLENATITVLETGEKVKTDENGNYGPINYPVGKSITLLFEKKGYQTTQSATVVVPPAGLTGTYDNITFQIPSMETYYLMAAIIGATIDDDQCHLATTITAYHKTMDDSPQGEAGAKLTISPSVDETPFYFGIFEHGPLKGKTNPFPKGLTVTSEDGGAALFNLPPRDEPYVISAEKDGVVFNSAQFICRKGVFINISPPRGPMVQK